MFLIARPAVDLGAGTAAGSTGGLQPGGWQYLEEPGPTILNCGVFYPVQWNISFKRWELTTPAGGKIKTWLYSFESVSHQFYTFQNSKW